MTSQSNMSRRILLNLPRDFLAAYLIVFALRAAPRLRRKQNLQKISDDLRRQAGSPTTLKEAFFLVALPATYRALRRRYPGSVIPALLCAPLLQLLEPSLQRTCAVYVATAAAVNSGRGSRLRQALPPTWMLIFPANAWLLWAFLFQRKSFPRGYGELILRHSGYGSREPTEKLVDFLRESKFETYPPGVLEFSDSGLSLRAHPVHTRAVCARLHPATSSCTETYIRAWTSEFPKVWKWVGGFGALALILRRRGRLLEKPMKTLLEWIISTTWGTAFVVGTINTCWGLTCLLQRVLKPGRLPHLRWIANGLLGNLWILVLPAARRAEFALYCTRLALGSLWDLSGVRTKHGESVVLAVAWAILLRDQLNGMAPQGLAGLILNYIDGRFTQK